MPTTDSLVNFSQAESATLVIGVSSLMKLKGRLAELATHRLLAISRSEILRVLSAEAKASSRVNSSPVDNAEMEALVAFLTSSLVEPALLDSGAARHSEEEALDRLVILAHFQAAVEVAESLAPARSDRRVAPILLGGHVDDRSIKQLLIHNMLTLCTLLELSITVLFGLNSLVNTDGSIKVMFTA